MNIASQTAINALNTINTMNSINTMNQTSNALLTKHMPIYKKNEPEKYPVFS